MELVDARFWAYVTVSALLIVIPGPDMALVTRNALAAGRRAASITAFGVGLGILGWAGASAFGVAVVLQESILAFSLLKLAGAAYLVYLGLRGVIGSRSAHDRFGEGLPAPSRIPLGDCQALQQGILGNLLNPKAGVIFVSILPQFVRPDDPPLRLLLMLVAFEVMIVVWLNLYGYLVCRAGQSRLGSQFRRTIERVTGLVLIGLGLRLAAERR